MHDNRTTRSNEPSARKANDHANYNENYRTLDHDCDCWIRRWRISKNQNPAAAGGVCDLQARRSRDGWIIGRRVNTNGRAREEGESFRLDADTLEQWRSIERSSR